MTDTSPEMEAEFRKRLMALPPEGRWRRGALMFDAARTMVKVSMPEWLPEDERRRWLWQRLYPEVPLPERALMV